MLASQSPGKIKKIDRENESPKNNEATCNFDQGFESRLMSV